MPALVSRDDCCFGALPIKTATYIVGVIELIFAITGLFMAVGAIAHNYEHATLMNKIIFALQIVYFLLYIFLDHPPLFRITQQSSQLDIYAFTSIRLYRHMHACLCCLGGIGALLVFADLLHYHCCSHDFLCLRRILLLPTYERVDIRFFL